VVPADRKWFARICASAIIAHTLIEIDPRYPRMSDEARSSLAAARNELVAEAPKGAVPDPFVAAKEGAAEGKKSR
jgi:hypothetical protein